MNMSLDVREKDLATLRSIFVRFPSVRVARLFGSRAARKARRASDIDLAITAPDITDTDWSRLAEELEHAPIIYKLDILRLDTLTHERLRQHIDSDGFIIYTS